MTYVLIEECDVIKQLKIGFYIDFIKRKITFVFSEFNRKTYILNDVTTGICPCKHGL